MSDETENRGYNKPQVGEEDWHVPLNENFDQIDADIYDIEQRLENYGNEGSTARFERFVHEPTNAPVEGSIVEDHGSGSLDHWDGDTEPFEVISSDTIVGEHSVRLDHPGGEESYSYQMGTETVITRRGEVYSCFVRFDEIDERNQSGLTVCGKWDEDGIIQGYLARLEEDGDLQILKYADGEFVESSNSASIDLETGVRYRIEIELGWDDTTARAFNANDDELASTTWEGETDLTSGGAGYGGRWANGSDGETVTFDHITRKSLDASPARVAGSASSSGSSNGVETGGYNDWDVLVTENDGSYEALDAYGNELFSTGDAASALNDAVDETPSGGTLVVKGHYPMGDNDEWEIQQDIRILGYSAVLDATSMTTSGMGSEHFVFIGNDRIDSYGVDDLSTTSSEKAIVTFDDDVDGDIGERDVLYFTSSEYYESDASGGNNPNEKGELHIVAETPDSDFGNADTSDEPDDDQVTLMEPLVFDYDDLGDLDIVAYRNHKVFFEGFDMIGPDIWEPKVGGIKCIGVSDCMFRDLSIRELSYEAITLQSAYACRVQDCDIAYGASNFDSGDGYGVKLASASAYCAVERSLFHWNRHSVVFSGGRPRRNCTIKDCTFTYDRSTALDMHGEDMKHRIVNCTFHMAHDEAANYGNDTLFRGCTFDLRDEDDAIYKSSSRSPPFGASLTVDNCIFRNFDRAVRVDDEDSDFNFLTITGCVFDTADDHLFRVRDTTLPDVTFTGNRVENCPEGFVNRGEIERGTFTGNTFVNCGTCLDPEDEGGDTQNITVSGNTAYDCDTFIACDSDDEDWAVLNNHMIGGDTFIDGSGGGDWVVDQNVIRGASEGWTGDAGSNFTY